MKYIKTMNLVSKNLTKMLIKIFLTFIVMLQVIVELIVKLQLTIKQKEFIIIGCQDAVCMEKIFMDMIVKMKI